MVERRKVEQKISLHISTFEQLCVIRIQNFRGIENSAKTEFAVSTEKAPFFTNAKLDQPNVDFLTDIRFIFKRWKTVRIDGFFSTL